MSDHGPAVIVFGASRGLGHHIALALGQAGFSVGLACRKLDDSLKIVDEIKVTGGNALPLVVDVTDFQSVSDAVNKTIEWNSDFLGIVNNAGMIDPIGRIGDTPPEQWRQLIDVNVLGVYHGVRASMPHLKAGGVIVNISSGAASKPHEGWSAYCASKAAVAMLTQSLSSEYSEQGILAYGFRPGVVNTDMQGKIRSSGINQISQIPQTDLLNPDIPAKAVAWLFKVRPTDIAGHEIDIRDEEFLKRVECFP